MSIADVMMQAELPDLAGPTRHELVAPVAVLVRQLERVIDGLTDEQYVRRPVGVMDSSVGGHVRHCLDHVRALLDAAAAGELDYDRRIRGTSVESDRGAALEEAARLGRRLDELTDADLLRPLLLSALMTADAAAVLVPSNVGREFVYVLAHTVHHNAMIGGMVKTLGGVVPERFGYAPSTVRHLTDV